MALAVFQRTIVDNAGNVLNGASVTIRKETVGAPLAVLYQDRDGMTLAGNPVTADANGFVRVFLDGGAYKITATSGSTSITWRYQGVGTAQEYDFDDVGALVQNVDAGWALTFESETSAPPSAGSIRFNNADLSAATEAYVDDANLGGSDITDLLMDLYSAGRTRKDRFTLHDPANNTQASFQIDGATDSGDYITFTISGHVGDTSLTDGEQVNMQPEKSGPDGSVSGPGSSTDNAAARFDGTSGALIQNSASGPFITDAGGLFSDAAASGAFIGGKLGAGTLSAPPNNDLDDCNKSGLFWATSGTANKPSSSETNFIVDHREQSSSNAWQMAFGIFTTEVWVRRKSSSTWQAWVQVFTDSQVATDAQIYAGTTGNQVIVSEHLKDAAASVTLTEAGSPSIGWDWTEGINRTLTLTADGTLGNPTNEIPRTERSILVKGNDGTARTLTFDSEFLGDTPTLDDITSSVWYLLVIVCVDTSHFAVSAKKVKG